MTWDEDGRLQSVIDNGGQPTTFKYDGDTNRVVKKGEHRRRNALHQPVVRGGARAELEADLRGHHAHRDQARDLAHRRGLRAGRQEPQGGRAIFLPPGPFGEHGLRHRRHRRGLAAPGDTSRSARPGSTRSPTILRVRYRFTGQELDQETRAVLLRGDGISIRRTSPRGRARIRRSERCISTRAKPSARRLSRSLATAWRTLALRRRGPGAAPTSPRNLNGFGYSSPGPGQVSPTETGRWSSYPSSWVMSGTPIRGLPPTRPIKSTKTSRAVRTRLPS